MKVKTCTNFGSKSWQLIRDLQRGVTFDKKAHLSFYNWQKINLQNNIFELLDFSRINEENTFISLKMCKSFVTTWEETTENGKPEWGTKHCKYLCEEQSGCSEVSRNTLGLLMVKRGSIYWCPSYTLTKERNDGRLKKG